MPPTPSTVRPLKPRPGARYTCFGDGLCCTDLHGLGPLTKREVRQLKLISSEVVLPPDEDGFDEPMLRTRDDGGCLFLGRGRCELHAALGEEAKPDGCRRFPLGVTATPSGGRITTRHRCPCRTLGERPLVTPESTEPSVVDAGGRVTADRRVGAKVRIRPGAKVPFAEYEALEARMLERLAAGEAPEAVLDAKPFPDLRGPDWEEVAKEMLEEGREPTRFGAALGWFAESILVAVRSRYRRREKERPWADAFDRAEARSPEPREPTEMLADWVADEIWAMDWTEAGGSLALARADLATRLAVAQDLRKRFASEGQRQDRATAEAICVVDLVGASEWWEDVIAAMRV